MRNLILSKAASALFSAVLLSPAGTQTALAQVPTNTGKAPLKAVSSPYHPSRFPKRAELLYSQVWGIDDLTVRTVEAGELVRFSYRVVDPDRAKALIDKKLEPSLIDPQARVRLVIPELEKVGKLRQTSTPAEGRSYWMAFSNNGRVVKRGDRVTIVIGHFRAEGLVVE